RVVRQKVSTSHNDSLHNKTGRITRLRGTSFGEQKLCPNRLVMLVGRSSRDQPYAPVLAALSARPCCMPTWQPATAHRAHEVQRAGHASSLPSPSEASCKSRLSTRDRIRIGQSPSSDRRT